MPDNRFTIRTMNREEMQIAIDWAAAEGWNPGLSDTDNYFAADPNGFLVGLLNDEPIATISAVKYDDSFGFLGFYIVKPEQRGKGYGMQIWNAGLDYLAGCNIGLDGVVDQQANYKRSGFKLAYRNIRYEGIGGSKSPEDVKAVALTSLPFEMVDAYERPFFPASRSRFSRAWINQPDSQALGIVQGERLVGYGVIRPCRNGYKIGPLCADSPELAEQLFLELRAKAKSTDAVFLDTPEANPAATALAERHGMKLSFETARMYTGAFPEMPLHRIFGITSFEIG